MELKRIDPDPEIMYTLTLSNKDLEALHSVLRRVGGAWIDSRKRLDDLRVLIAKEGIPHRDTLTGSLLFE